MIIDTKFSPLVVRFDVSDLESMQKIGIEGFFEENKETFDLNAFAYYNGEPFFVLRDGSTICMACMGEEIEGMELSDIDCLTALYECEDGLYCDSCNETIHPLYEDD